MTHTLRGPVWATLLVLSFGTSALAQSKQVWPETSTFPITRHFEYEMYFEHQNDSGGSSNRTVNAVGVVVNLYF